MESTVKICKVCGQPKSLSDFQMSDRWHINTCKKCQSKRAVASFKRRSTANPELYQKLLSYEKDRHAKQVQAVLDHYGRECECCGETEEKFLTVDHIEGIGSYKKRVELGHNRMYSWLVRNNFPPGYRLLCSNCNHGRARNGGVCPHQEGSQARAQARSRKCGEVPETLMGQDMVEAGLKSAAVPLLFAPFGLQ